MGCTKCNTACDSNCNCVVRYTGPSIDCLGINTEDSFDTVLSKLSSYVCDINFEDGVGIQNMTYDSVTDDFEVTLTDGTVYNFTGLQGNDGQSIDHTSFTSSSLGGAASQPGATDTYTVWGDPGESINLGTFTVYNGDNANSLYGNTLFVDDVYGDNNTALRERFDLPFLTIQAAITDASPGDTVVVRPGNYTGDITLKDGVNMYFEEGSVTTGQITDNGVSVDCNIDGYLQSESVTTDAISLTGSNTDVECTLSSINVSNTAIFVRPAEVGSPKSRAVFNINKVTGLIANYFTTIYGNAHVTIDIKERVETEATTSTSVGFAGFYVSEDFRGSLNFKCPHFFIGNTTHQGGGILYQEESTNLKHSDVTLDIDLFESTYDDVPSAPGIISKSGSSRMIVNIKEFRSITRTPIKILEEKTIAETGVVGSIVFNGNVYSENYPCVHYKSNQKATLRGAFKRGSGGNNEAVTIMAGDNSTYGSSPGPTNGWKLELKGATVIKDGGSTTDAVGEVVSKRSSDDPIYITDSYIHFFGLGSPKAISGSATTDNNFYVRGTIGNLDNTGATINNISVGGAYTFDSEFKQFEDK